MLYKKLRVYSKVLEKIKSAQKIVCLSHKNPDLDTLWSACWIYQIILDNYPTKEVDLVCIDKIPQKYEFLPNVQNFKQNFDPDDYDLIIFLDSWAKDQTWFDELYPKMYDKQSYNTLSIDHHITNQIYAKQNILIVTYASTTMIVLEVFYLNWLIISPDAATCLLAGLYTDTWAFKHSNTDKTAFLIASKLFELGWNHDIIVNSFFRSNKLSTIKLWWKIINDSFIWEDNVLYAYVNQTMLDSYNSTYEDITWVVDYLNTAENINYTTLLTQKWDYIKASLRTLKDDIDLTKIASKYKWWWHKKASWFTVQAKVEQLQSLNLIPE